MTIYLLTVYLQAFQTLMVRQEETRERGKRIHLLEENAAFKNTIP
jgi:hypothetical protein